MHVYVLAGSGVCKHIECRIISCCGEGLFQFDGSCKGNACSQAAHAADQRVSSEGTHSRSRCSLFMLA